MLTFQAPASKSVSHRMLIGAALAPGHSVLHHVLECDDTRRTRSVLRAAGAVIEPLGQEGSGNWTVQGMPEGARGSMQRTDAVACHVGESGTSCRLLTAILAAGQGFFHLSGAPRLHERPIGDLVTALKSMGAHIEMERPGYPPLCIEGRKLCGGEIRVALNESSQYISGLLLAAPFCTEPARFVPSGSKVLSWPYVSLTLHVLELFGIQVEVENLHGEALDWRTLHTVLPNSVSLLVHPGRYRAGEYTVEGDWSGASYLLAAGAIGRTPVCVQGLRSDSLQGDRVLLDILRGMGATVDVREHEVLVAPSRLQGLVIDMGACPDIVPTVAVLAAFAHGATHICNVPHLRVKECDRLSAVAQELARVGVRVDEMPDGLVVHGQGGAPCVPDGVCFAAHNDHRIAMSMALFGLHGTRVDVDDRAVVNKSFPLFWEAWQQLSHATMQGV